MARQKKHFQSNTTLFQKQHTAVKNKKKVKIKLLHFCTHSLFSFMAVFQPNNVDWGSDGGESVLFGCSSD